MTPSALRGMAVNDVGRARISMMVRSTSSNSRPDTLVQDRTPQLHCFLLQRTADPYIDVARGLVLSLRNRHHSSWRTAAAARGARKVGRIQVGSATPELTDGAAFDERCRRTMTVDIDEGKAFRKIILYVSASTLARGDAHIPLLHPDDLEESRKVWSACLRTGDPQSRRTAPGKRWHATAVGGGESGY